MLAGIDIFQKIIDLQNTIQNKKNIKFTNKIQTNATLIDQEWTRFFRNNNIGIGLSLDGDKQIHDENRIFSDGNGSFEKVVSGINALKENRMTFSVLSVVTRRSISNAKEIYRFFVDNGIKRFDFLPFVEIDNQGIFADDSLSKGDFSLFMNDIFDSWFSNDDPEISVRFLEDILVSILGGHPSLCKLSGTCLDYITIDHNGDVFPCDNFIGNPELKYGTIAFNELSEILNTARAVNIKNLLSQKHDECDYCRVNQICNGGCNKYRYMWNNNFNSVFYFCEDYRRIINHVTKVIETEHPKLAHAPAYN